MTDNMDSASEQIDAHLQTEKSENNIQYSN